MMVPSASDRQIADSVLPAQIDEPAVPTKLNRLFPWHRPRKQLVREEQWIYFSRRLIETERGRRELREPPNGEPEVRYLTLPGIDYLDVRLLADLCRETDCCLTSTGFQSGDESNPNVARAQLREKSLIDAGYITKDSHTFPRRFEDIVHTNSSTYRDLKSRAPFHVVNIDACGSLARPGAYHANRLIDAVYRIVEIQLELMTRPWLLFVTADVRPNSIARETLHGLCEAIFENAEENEDFRNRVAPLLDATETDIRAAVRNASEKPGMAFLQLFSLGLAKWFLHLAKSENWDMKTHHPYCYSNMPPGDDTPSMACLAFEFLPRSSGLQDSFGVVRAEPARDSERGDTSTRAAEKIGGMSNADCKISSNKKLRDRLIEKLRELLDEAGYDPVVLEQIGA